VRVGGAGDEIRRVEWVIDLEKEVEMQDSKATHDD